jgi:hypothetical protein
MFSHITTGNASSDGQQFDHWFVGDLLKWSEKREPGLQPVDYGFRNTRSLEIKWGVHARGETRPSGWSQISDKITLSLLVRGKFLLRFRRPENSTDEWEHTLQEEGDYAVWQEEIEHTWIAQEESVILTVRWREDY